MKKKSNLTKQNINMIKKLFGILIFQLIIFTCVFSQVTPKGMNYQAIARDKQGSIISNAQISLRIYLFSNESNQRIEYYSEIHDLKTNALGLFNLVIGDGIKVIGNYGLIPWNTQNIWLEVALTDKFNNRLHSISNNRLLAVPYAMHSLSAEKLIQENTTKTSSVLPPGVVSSEWSVFGNAMTDASGNLYHINSLGTTDKVDLIMITDNVERLRILKSGDIVTKLNFNIQQNLRIGQNLNVIQSATIGDTLIAKKDVLFNIQGGSTINNGPFTVAQNSLTLLSGILTVNLDTKLNGALRVDGPTDLNSALCVNNMSPTVFTGTLQVDSISNLNDSLYVINSGPVVLTGTLLVDSTVTFNDRLKILSTYSTDTSGIAASGSLQVHGGLYIKENLYIGGIAKFGGPVGFGGAVTISDGTQSTSPTTGALRVSGGVGIGLNLNVGGAAMLGKPGDMTFVKDLTESMDTLTGALKVLGGMGVLKSLNGGGNASFAKTLQVTGNAALNDSLNVANNGIYVAYFKNNGNNNGINIKVANDAPNPGHDNNFVEFRKQGGARIGRISGENVNEYLLNPRYIYELDKLETAVFGAQASFAIAIVTAAVTAAGIIAAAASVTTCTGLGIMACIPVISLVIRSVLDFAAAELQLVSAGAAVDDAVNAKNFYITYKANTVGVTYESGSGDYAEWLPTANPKESFLAGQIVGLKNGRISKNLQDANKLMVISTQPIVLGNMPQKNKELAFEKVAFLGQVPVFVSGKVVAGDYILPSGNSDGIGIAVAPHDMKTEDFLSLVGVAWSSSTSVDLKLINVGIGLNASDINKVVVNQRNKIGALETKINKRNEILSTLVRGYNVGTEIQHDQISSMKLSKTITSELSYDPSQINKTANSSISNLSKEKLSEILENAENFLKTRGIDPGGSSFFQQLKSDPAYKESLLQKMKLTIDNYSTTAIPAH